MAVNGNAGGASEVSDAGEEGAGGDEEDSDLDEEDSGFGIEGKPARFTNTKFWRYVDYMLRMLITIIYRSTSSYCPFNFEYIDGHLFHSRSHFSEIFVLRPSFRFIITTFTPICHDFAPYK